MSRSEATRRVPGNIPPALAAAILRGNDQFLAPIVWQAALDPEVCGRLSLTLSTLSASLLTLVCGVFGQDPLSVVTRLTVAASSP